MKSACDDFASRFQAEISSSHEIIENLFNVAIVPFRDHIHNNVYGQHKQGTTNCAVLLVDLLVFCDKVQSYLNHSYFFVNFQNLTGKDEKQRFYST